MENNIQTYYYNDWVNLEKENYFFFKEIEDNFINVKFYPIKILKSDLYKIIYYKENVTQIHDIKQCILDIPRLSGYLQTYKLNQFNLGEMDNDKLLHLLTKFYTNSEIVNIYNLIPQQIFYIIHEARRAFPLLSYQDTFAPTLSVANPAPGNSDNHVPFL